MVIWHVLSHSFPGFGLLATQWTVMFKSFKMCFNMFPYISFVLVGFAANFTFPNSAAKVINNCPHWLSNQAIKICKALNIMMFTISALKTIGYFLGHDDWQYAFSDFFLFLMPVHNIDKHSLQENVFQCDVSWWTYPCWTSHKDDTSTEQLLPPHSCSWTLISRHPDLKIDINHHNQLTQALGEPI